MSKRKCEDWWQPRAESSQAHIMHQNDGEDRTFCFVSHNGAHKHFAELLCRDLEAAGIRPAFFDKQSDSPDKGEASGAATLEVAGNCGIGIILLSEEYFTASKWTMMELAMLKELRPRIRTGCISPAKLLPVYYRLNVSQIKNYKRQDAWIETWNTMALGDSRINVSAWTDAMINIVQHTGIHVCKATSPMVSDDDGRRLIINRLTDPKNNFLEPGFRRRDVAAPLDVAPQVVAPQFVAPQFVAPQFVAPQVVVPQELLLISNIITRLPIPPSPLSSPPTNTCTTLTLLPTGETRNAVKSRSASPESDKEEEPGNEGSEEDEEADDHEEGDSASRQSTPSDDEVSEEDEDGAEVEDDTDDEDYQVESEEDGDGNSADNDTYTDSDSDGDDSG